MGRTKFGSPTLNLEITAEQYEEAVQSKSGGCLIADAIAKQYPELSRVSVDMATIRASDRKLGLRFTWLTPPPAQYLLLGFDQGWPQMVESLRIQRAVKVTPIVVNPRRQADRLARLQELEGKLAAGEELTTGETQSLAKLRKNPVRPSRMGRAQVSKRRGSNVVHGGVPIPHGPAHPNLLRGRDRHYGAKLADPGVAFTEAVDEAVAARLAELESNGESTVEAAEAELES